MRQILIHKDLGDVTTILEVFGLEVEELQEVAVANFSAQVDCTVDDAPTAPGFIGWNASVRALRELLTARGWVRKDIKNSPRIVNETGNMSIMVSTGDEYTGNSFATPSTKSVKGTTTRLAIKQNECSELLFLEEEIPQVLPVAAIGHSSKSTWIFLIYVHIDRASDTPRHIVRCELSLPVGMNDTGYVSAWSERIILPEITVDPDDLSRETEGFAPEQEIPLKRKK